MSTSAMTTTNQRAVDVHSCSLYCDRPECIKAQRDQMRDSTPGWRPISEAPRDGTRVLLANEHGCWMAEYHPVYVSGYRPENPWFSVMLNCDHIPRDGRYAKPTHFMPLPPPPGEGE